MSETDISELLRIREVSKILKVHRETLRRWDKSGKLKAVRIGSRKDRRYKKEDIKKFVDSM
jgi:excisionase family DNA binding protein